MYFVGCRVINTAKPSPINSLSPRVRGIKFSNILFNHYVSLWVIKPNWLSHGEKTGSETSLTNSFI